ncbi:MAG: hypothetical protein A2381_05000 [Bdellovibrionales bacterium RIFOXYB1_FULL_37_110]|nr:MAG: hypothetical protein A2417_16480 [Bdellovibrionales bacterium RIFOXYC1_FULL_37_79]OFZ58106.1 MAG: hypothetical protein A2381_05000 [Bdellovibrionales bacterium RIFOXYB1_FULL_37_110]OFZ61795.1 MAG: hypothetical protein A2577_18585 [Bdellovibrionales bacterium RIFOXYD1_FULL_36_51]
MVGIETPYVSRYMVYYMEEKPKLKQNSRKIGKINAIIFGIGDKKIEGFWRIRWKKITESGYWKMTGK